MNQPARIAAPKKDQLCDHCHQQKPVLYLVKHHETAVHWRCQKCLNQALLGGHTYLLLGVRTRNMSCHASTTYLAASRAADAAHLMLSGMGETAGGQPG